MPRNGKATTKAVRAGLRRNKPMPQHKLAATDYDCGISDGLYAVRTARPADIPLRVHFSDRTRDGRRNLSPSRRLKLWETFLAELSKDPDFQLLEGSYNGGALILTVLDCPDVRDAFWFVESVKPTQERTVILAESAGTDQFMPGGRRRDYSARAGEGSAEPHVTGHQTREELDRTDARRSELMPNGQRRKLTGVMHDDRHSESK